MIRLLLALLCLVAAPAGTLASTLCCEAADACCDDPCAADETPAADDHCALSAGASTPATLSPAPDAAPLTEATFGATTWIVASAAPTRTSAPLSRTGPSRTTILRN